MGKPSREVEVDVTLASTLLREQCPRFADESVRAVGEGWDNFVFRVGAERALRIPRRESAVPFLSNEQRFLPDIARRISVVVPSPLFAGVPSARFRWPWSVVPWIDGEAGAPLRSEAAVALAGELRSLHVLADDRAPRNPYRGVPLRERRAAVEPRIDALGLSALLPVWKRAVAAPVTTAPRWLHGDLHPHNLLSVDGSLVGIIDWGDLGAGDVATDLACAWMLFEQPDRAAFLAAYGPDEETVTRAAGWAVNIATALIGCGVPHHVAVGRRTVQALLADASRA